MGRLDTRESIKNPKGGKTTALVAIESYPAIKSIVDERRRQNEKLGEQCHSLAGWMCVLMEEVGEAAKEVCDGCLNNADDPVGYIERFRMEMVQVAAVAIQILEAIDRGKGK